MMGGPRDALRDIVYELLDHAKHDHDCREPRYRQAMFLVLGLIKSQARTFALDEEYLCLADFDPLAWYLQMTSPAFSENGVVSASMS